MFYFNRMNVRLKISKPKKERFHPNINKNASSTKMAMKYRKKMYDDCTKINPAASEPKFTYIKSKTRKPKKSKKKKVILITNPATNS